MKEKFSCVFKRIFLYISQNTLLVSFFLTVSIGVLIGALVLHSSSDGISTIPDFFSQYVTIRQGASFWVLFSRSFFAFALPLVLCYFCGVFMYGYFPCYLLLLIRGMGYGAVCGYLYASMGLKGIAFVLLVLLPPAFIHFAVLLVAACEAFRFSVLLTKNYYLDIMVIQPSAHVKRYHIRFGVLLGFVLLSALLDGVLSYVFFDVFIV